MSVPHALLPVVPPLAAPSTVASCFLRIAQSGARLSSRQELADWLSGPAQELLPHRALLVADAEPASRWVQVQWCDPAGTAPKNEVLVGLAQAWVARREGPWPPRPCRFDFHTLEPALPGRQAREAGDGAPAFWVHGPPLSPGGRYRLFVLQEREPADPSLALELLAPFIEAALRRSASLGNGAGMG